MSESLPPWLAPLWSRFDRSLADDRLGHALLIGGEAGLGKRLLARRMVARLLDADADAADGGERGRHWLAAGSHPDFLDIHPEEDSRFIKVDQIRALNEWVHLTGQAGTRRVVLIDPAEAMNREAQNALLKTLEEPPPGVHLLLVGDTPAQLLATVRSRCQDYTVAAPDRAAARTWLAGQGQSVDDGLLDLAAGHPGFALRWQEPERARRLQAVAADLHGLATGHASVLAVASRWSDDAAGHVEDAIAWLRLWSWQGHAAVQGVAAAPPASPRALADAGVRALRLRQRLDAPLKPAWLIHEWLVAWQSAATGSR